MNDEERMGEDVCSGYTCESTYTYPQPDEQKEFWLYVFKMELDRSSNNTRSDQIEWAIEAADIALSEFNKRWDKNGTESQEHVE